MAAATGSLHAGPMLLNQLEAKGMSPAVFKFQGGSGVCVHEAPKP